MLSDRRISEMAGALVGVPGVVAVALGGSRARGTHHEGSDVDLGLYYDSDRLDLEALRAAAEDVSPGATVSGPGGWEPWVDGGGWLTVDGTAVDWIAYPPALREAMVANLWQAGFLVEAARKGVAKQDVAYVMLCCSTALMLCAHAWHATAGAWPTNEKGLVVDVERLDIDTHDFAARAGRALTTSGMTHEDLALLVERVGEVVDDAVNRLRSPGQVDASAG